MDSDTTLHDLPPSAPPIPLDGGSPFEEISPSEILDELQSLSLTDTRRRKLICMAEVLRFERPQAAALRSLLRKYINAYHDPRDRDEEVVVASAIRKFIASLPVTDLLECQDWLKIERKMPPPMEMEVVKMIVRKLTATLPEDVGYLGPLGDQLMDLVRSYLTLRVLSKHYFGATVLQSSLSLALMRSPHLAELSDRLRTIRSDVLRFVVASQAKLLSVEIEKRFPGSRGEPARQALTSLATAAETVQS